MTVVPAVALLFSGVGSGVADEMVAILSKFVPGGVPAGTLAVNVKVPPAPDARVPMVQITAPPAPTAGVLQVQPAGEDRLTNVSAFGGVPGSASDN